MKKNAILAVTLLVLIAVGAFAQTNGHTNGFYWEQTSDGRGVVVIGYDGPANEVTIPDWINNLEVVTIGSGAFSNGDIVNRITVVRIPSSVITIEREAFMGAVNLTTVALSNGLITIGVSAFSGCRSLARITLPATVETIGSSAFRDCRALTTVTTSASVTSIAIGDRAFERTQLNASTQTRLKNLGYTGTF